MLNPAIAQPAGSQCNLLTEFFDGHVEAWGLVLTRFGGARRRYSIEMNGFWSGPEFVLDETFIFDKERIDRRSWFFTFGENGEVTGECADLNGIATGKLLADELCLDYIFNVPIGGRTLPVRFDDRMFRIDDRTMGGHAVMKKFGIRFGEMFTLFRRS